MNLALFNELKNLCTGLVKQQRHLLPLCAAENVISPFSKIPLNTFLQEKYIMGGVLEYQNDNNFIGSEKLYDIYTLLAKQCEKMFGAKYSDARTLSGVNAVMTLVMSLFEAGDTILISSEDSGGHGSMPKICHRLGIKTVNIPFDYESNDINYEKCNKLLATNDFKGMLICVSDIIKAPHLHKLTLPPECTLIFDATQVLGLIATNAIENPFDCFKDNQKFILMGATHKTLPGPTCGLIMTKNLKLAQSFDTLINPDYLRNNQLHHILCLIMTLMEMDVYGAEYSNATISNANYLGESLERKGFELLKINGKNQYTDTHQLFISMPLEKASVFYASCNHYGVTVNLRNKLLYRNCGIRIGTQEISRYGWGNKECDEIAEILSDIFKCSNSKHIGDRIDKLTVNKQIHFTIENTYLNEIDSILHNSQF